jgi:inhibitor of KinA
MPVLTSLGDSALLVKFGDEIDPDLNRRVQALAALLGSAPLDGVGESLPAYASLLVHYDPLRLDYAEVAEWVSGFLDQAEAAATRPAGRIEVPVRYGGESGPDLEAVAAFHKISPAEVVRLHSSRTYTVYMMGFTPGFPYLGALDPRLVTPRLETPRTLVPAGTVAIAGQQSGIYPLASPGGWQLIGWTPLQLFDLSSEQPFLFAPGDEVRFVPFGGFVPLDGTDGV